MTEKPKMNKADYSKYICPYEHIEKECGHELKGPDGYEGTYGIWCACGFRGPVFALEPEELNLKLKTDPQNEILEITKDDLQALKHVTEICSGAYWSEAHPSNIGARGWIEEAERVISKYKDEI